MISSFKRGIIKVCICVSCLCICGDVYADQTLSVPHRVSLDGAIDSALATMEDIKISEAETEQAYHKYRETQTLQYPDLSGYAVWENNARYPVNARYPAGQISDYDAAAGAVLNQLICSFGRVSAAVEASRKGLEMSRWNEKVKKIDVVYSAKVAYYTSIYAQRALDIVIRSYENSLDNKRILQNRSAMGRVSRKDNIKIEADIAARIPFVSNMEAKVLSSENTLKRRMGLPLDVEIELTDGFRKEYSKQDFVSLSGYLWQREPTLKMLEENISMHESLVKAEKAEYYPYISAFATWDYSGRSDQSKEWYIGDEDLMDQFGVIGLKMTFPIFDCGRIRENILQAEKAKDKAVLELKRTSRDLSLELDNAVSEYNEYLKTLDANIQSVDLAEKSFKLYQDLFEIGQVTLLELNDAELSLTNQRIERETTLYNLNVMLARIERLIAEGVQE